MDYKTVLQEKQHHSQRLNPKRFAKISERIDRCDIPVEAWIPLLENAMLQTWKGIILNKSVTEIGVYPMLIHELQPKTIIELGAFNGGSAIWLADHLELFGIKGRVYSMDIDLSLLDEGAKQDSRVHFLQGDSNDLAATFPGQMLWDLPHPWLLIEDSHVNLVGILEYFHQNGFQSGDYLIVEDTSQSMWDYWRKHWDDAAEVEEGARKLKDLRDWLKNHEDDYLIDTYYQDMYGYNGSKNWNSILKRV
ncbi:MAG: cephalosporin hydroxylase [Moorea sp. SIOASIH]|uniref:CmcI family methyltransferase n=1 Tax=Moorena sp. SIOASIH TaxID=2607817 RepID=UPI0013B6919A|nr:CmcI family methyltransferase [Moorena sp. SIOASIH]NEO39822.1 cephalosporin hydroxylase [Moorena sp. SIOASIH]